MTRMNDMIERYGECVTATKAAHILGCTPRTVARMAEDGRLSRACRDTMIDVRSIAQYIESPAEHDSEARFQNKMRKRGIKCDYRV